MDYDLVVVGSGPAGQKAAIQGAKLGKNIALAERHVSLGGACVNTGTIPSKTIREAILYLTGLNQRAIYGQSYRLKDAVSIEDIALRTRHVVERETRSVRARRRSCTSDRRWWGSAARSTISSNRSSTTRPSPRRTRSQRSTR